MATDINIKAKALSDARARILALQAQMTDRVVAMAAEIEKLVDIIPTTEAKAFLKARCNLPAVELATYIRFSKTLKGAEDVLRGGRTSFPATRRPVKTFLPGSRQVPRSTRRMCLRSGSGCRIRS
jgi:DNA (cytosine-5)-methyltransferase 1